MQKSKEKVSTSNQQTVNKKGDKTPSNKPLKNCQQIISSDSFLVFIRRVNWKKYFLKKHKAKQTLGEGLFLWEQYIREVYSEEAIYPIL